jgi:alkanesulfonate monooxygenase SsuD/methylene tetrahydromethanopterin reductase-like flavin-dependent oxidoreductase (luciferase family)
MSDHPLRVGLLLPHFGAQADGRRIIAGAVRAEELGFDSVWVRDHIVYAPHGFEDKDPAFLEAFTVLTAVGAATSRLLLGTGALIPFRHPLHTALVASSITRLVGPRLILGIGSGNSDHEFAAAGLPDYPRVELAMATVSVLRGSFSGRPLSLDAGPFRFADVSLSPGPAGGSFPIWYCGNTPRSVRLAVEACDGWMPGRIHLATLRDRVAALTDLAHARDRPPPAVGIIPAAAVDTDRERALAQVNVDGLLAWANQARFWRKPASGAFTDVSDLEGLLVYGTPDDVIAQCLRLRDAGVGHLVFDFRMNFDRWEDQIELIGTRVLPHLPGGR